MSRSLVPLVLLFGGLALGAHPPIELPQSRIAYTIEARLDPETRALDGRETIVWNNPLEVPIDSLPMHLYLNAFSHDRSSWYRSTPGARFTLDRTLRRHEDPWGWSEPTSIRQGGVELDWQPIAPDDGNALDRSLIEVTLAEPLAPGETLTLEVEWDGRLPTAAARTGGHGDFFFGAQWFPKIAGIRPDGSFNRHQFHGPTEFFADFADYDVRVGVPHGWGFVATGRGGLERSEGATDWHHYRQRAVIDFAWATGAAMVDAVHTHGEVEVHIFQPEGLDAQLPRWRAIVEASIDTMSRRVAPYPYDVVTVVLPPHEGLRTVGMEYPTFFTGMPGGRHWDGPLGSVRLNEVVIAHEFAHQYFQLLVATNEFEDAFMDEGMTEYWGMEILVETYGEAAGGGTIFGRPIRASSSNLRTRPSTRSRPPIWSGPSYLLRGVDIGSQFYNRPAAAFQTAARLYGQDVVDAIFAAYTRRHAFAHPRIEDFWQVAREVGGDPIADFLREAFVQPQIPDFRVVEIEARPRSEPRGHPRGTDDEGRDEDGMITVEIVDPGYTRERRVAGRIERRRFVPEMRAAVDGFEADDERLWVSQAAVAGPGWDHLPVRVELRFADGAVVVDEWDGKALRRDYRIVRAAPLAAVVIDPEDRIRLDVVPINDGLSRQGSVGLARDWGWWSGALFQWLAEGVCSWL